MAIQFRCPSCGVTLTTESMPTGPLACPKCEARIELSGEAGGEAVFRVDTGDDDSTLGALGALVPWAASLVFHVAVFLAALFVVLTVRESDNLDRVVIPDTRLTPKPGGAIRPAPEQNHAQTAATLRQMRMPLYQKRAETLLSANPSERKSDLQIVGIGAPSGSTPTGLRGFGGGGPKASFLGSGGNAYRIVYVIDRSGSMIETMDYVKLELRKSINALQPIQSFHVIFFSSENPVELVPRKLSRALPRRKEGAFEFLNTIVAEGRTDPIPALEAAFRVPGGPPDLIYFMTDGEFDPIVVKQIARWNREKKVKVNTIAFLYHSGEALLKQIASENGGRYTFFSSDDLGG